MWLDSIQLGHVSRYYRLHSTTRRLHAAKLNFESELSCVMWTHPKATTIGAGDNRRQGCEYKSNVIVALDCSWSPAGRPSGRQAGWSSVTSYWYFNTAAGLVSARNRQATYVLRLSLYWSKRVDLRKRATTSCLATKRARLLIRFYSVINAVNNLRKTEWTYVRACVRACSYSQYCVAS